MAASPSPKEPWLRRLQSLLEHPATRRFRQYLGAAGRVLRRLLASPPRLAPSPWKWPSLVGIWAARAVAWVVLALLAVHLNVLWLFGSSPSLSSIQNPDFAVASEVWSADTVLLGRFWLQDRTPVERRDIPTHLVQALISTEDARFYQHRGVDLVAPFAVAWSVAKGDARGGSTLAQQLAKNLYDTRRATSRGLLGRLPGIRQVVWKTKEWITALQLEALHSKDDILVLYLNTVSFGGNTYGLQSASRFFFDREPRELTIEESALLVGVLKAPSFYSPLKHPARSRERRNVVLSQMLRYGHLTQRARDSLAALPVTLRLRVASPADGAAPWYRAELARWLKDWCQANGYNLLTDGLVIRTTLDSRLQAHADSAVTGWMRELQKRFDAHWAGQNPWRYADHSEIPHYLDSVGLLTPHGQLLMERYHGDTALALAGLREKIPMRLFTWKGVRDTVLSPLDSLRRERTLLRAGFLAMDPYTGAVKAWVGGIDHEFFPWDHVSQARRQPGSTFKPFVYGEALRQGWSPCQKLMDKPVTITYVENGETKTWSPHNADWTNTMDSMTLRHALGRSINTITAQLTERVGPANVARFAHRMGVHSHLDTVPSIGLGSNPVSLLELVGAYLPFVNGGEALAPWFVDRIEDRSGRVLAVFRPRPRRVLSSQISWLMIHMLKGGLEEPLGTSQNLWSFDLFGKGGEMAGKTGTSSDHADGWFVGISPDLVMAAWTGAEDPSIHFRTGELGEGSKTALPIVGRFLEASYRDHRIGLVPRAFAKAPPGLTVKWNCPTPWDRYRDTTAVDSTAVDSTAASEGETFPF